MSGSGCPLAYRYSTTIHRSFYLPSTSALQCIYHSPFFQYVTGQLAQHASTIYTPLQSNLLELRPLFNKIGTIENSQPETSHYPYNRTLNHFSVYCTGDIKVLSVLKQYYYKFSRLTCHANPPNYLLIQTKCGHAIMELI